MKKINREKTTHLDILKAIRDFSADVASKEDLKSMATKEDLKALVTKDFLNDELNKFRAQMVTKSYLDDKLAVLKGDIIFSLKQGDKKTNTLVHFLTQEKSLSKQSAEKVSSIKIFKPLPKYAHY